jgi:hypothetical protein
MIRQKFSACDCKDCGQDCFSSNVNKLVSNNVANNVGEVCDCEDCINTLDSCNCMECSNGLAFVCDLSHQVDDYLNCCHCDLCTTVCDDVDNVLLCCDCSYCVSSHTTYDFSPCDCSECCSHGNDSNRSILNEIEAEDKFLVNDSNEHRIKVVQDQNVTLQDVTCGEDSSFYVNTSSCRLNVDANDDGSEMDNDLIYDVFNVLCDKTGHENYVDVDFSFNDANDLLVRDPLQNESGLALELAPQVVNEGSIASCGSIKDIYLSTPNCEVAKESSHAGHENISTAHPLNPLAPSFISGVAVDDNSSLDISGGFRILLDNEINLIPNIVTWGLDGPLTRFQDNLIYAHRKIYLSGAPNYQCCRIPIETDLNISAWRQCLKDYIKDPLLPELLAYGFPVGYCKDVLPAASLRNHSGATSFSSVIDKYLDNEIAACNIIGPFTANPLIAPLMISPINSVPKRNTLDRRVICDLSYPESFSVNDGISKDMYLGEQVNLSYPTVDNLASLIREVGPNAFLFKKDLYKAYRQFAVDPGDIHLLGYRWNDKLFIDLSLVMGARSAAFLCQRVTNAVVFISSGKHLVNYLDDVAGCTHRDQAWEKYEEFTELLNYLGLKESVEKAVQPSSSMEFLGVWFDAPTQTMRVTDERLEEIMTLLNDWLNKKSASKKELQSLIGKLQFVGRCVRGSRVFISRLLNTLSSLKRQHHRFRPSSQFKKDIIWWAKFVRSFNGVTLIPDMIWSKPDQVFSTDACLTGGGGWSNHKKFFWFKFPDFILNKSGIHINYLELLVVVVACRVWFHHIVNKRIQIYCDNMATVLTINSGRTKDPLMLELLRELAFLNASNNTQIRAIHISGVSNRRADKLSRYHMDENINMYDVIDSTWTYSEIPDEFFKLKNNW